MRHACPFGAASLLIGVLVFFGCMGPASAVRVSDGRPAMGTILEISLYMANADGGRALLDRLYRRVAEIEAELTTWDATSATSRLNASAGAGPVPVPSALRALLALGVRAARETDGAFDVSVGPLIDLWRRAGERGVLPTSDELDAARRRTGASGISLTGSTATLGRGMAISFDGIAKGWALDRLGEMLADAGVDRGLLDFGRSSWLARGTPPDADGWRVLIADQAGRRHLTVLRNESLSLSESLGQGFEIEGRSFGHVIDPRTGWPIEARRLAAVRSANGADAEVWSTALLVLSLEEGRARIDARKDLEALWIEADGRTHHTPGFRLERAVGLHGGAAR